MRILILLVSHEMNKIYEENIRILQFYLKNYEVDYCGISNMDDFSNLEKYIKFKYKMVNPGMQLSKVCDFITTYKHELDYDWYIKMRIDLKLLNYINFGALSTKAINARTRKYIGPKKMAFANTTNGIGWWSNIDTQYEPKERLFIMDDSFYIFTNYVIEKGAFDEYNGFLQTKTSRVQHEDVHTSVWLSRNIELNMFGVELYLCKYGQYSGHVNL